MTVAQLWYAPGDLRDGGLVVATFDHRVGPQLGETEPAPLVEAERVEIFVGGAEPQFAHAQRCQSANERLDEGRADAVLGLQGVEQDQLGAIARDLVDRETLAVASDQRRQDQGVVQAPVDPDGRAAPALVHDGGDPGRVGASRGADRGQSSLPRSRGRQKPCSSPGAPANSAQRARSSR